MKLEDLGYNAKLEQIRKDHKLDQFETGRILAEHRERYIVGTAGGEFEAEITGNLRFSAKSREDFPAVGDWVAIAIFEPDMAIIHAVLPRTSLIRRQAAGRQGEIQLIAANIDYALLVQAVDRDFNLNRLERYMAISYESGVTPVIVLSKTDLAGESRLKEIMELVEKRQKDTRVFAVSNHSGEGLEELNRFMHRGKTYCMLGSSGVGKSTLLNSLSGITRMKTGNISTSTGKGRHVTSHRELILLENGSILIDNPGMREVGITDDANALEMTFDLIDRLSGSCKFKDCTHTVENGCSVLEAVQKGELDRSSYENYLKLVRERAHYESTLAEKRKKDKDFGKIMKNYKKDMKKNRF